MTTFDSLRLDALVTSPTNPRKNFNEGRLQELADSIAASGVHQPILVRPLPAQRLLDTAHLKPRPTHEVVAGERRYRASKLAKVDTIPAMIRTLTDDQVLEIQIVENIQRDSLTALETAEGYKTLMDHTGLKPEEMEKKVGKKRTSIYNSLKLLELHPFAKQYLREETISASAAQLIARISDVGLQQKAAIHAASKDDAGNDISIRAFQAWLRDNVMLDLSKATFPIESISLTAAGSCKTCKTRTGHDPDLFADVKSDMCTHPPCYHLKAESHKQVLANMIKAKAPMPNRNVDEQQGLGLVSTLAQDARAELRKNSAEDQIKNNIIDIRAGKDLKISHLARHVIFDAMKDHIKATKANECCELLGSDVLRAWLIKTADWQDDDFIHHVFDMGLTDDILNGKDLQQAVYLRIQAASTADVYRYTTLSILFEDHYTYADIKPTLLLDAFASDHGIDLDGIRNKVTKDVEEDYANKIAALNQQIKATKPEKSPAKTTSTPPPAGAASDAAAADAKKQKPAPLRKAKTSAQEAISGIAAAMQGIEAEPLDASLGGSEAAAVDNGKLAVGAKVKILSGKHEGKEAVVKIEVSSDMWSVEIGNMFSVYLPTKSLQVIA